MKTLVLLLAISLFINMAMFLIAFRYRTDRLTDISYAVSFAVLTLYALLIQEITPERAILTALILAWAARLGTFLLIRIWKTGIDHRFDKMRDNFWLFSKFWLGQAVSVWIILIPTLLGLTSERLMFTALSYIGVGIWMAGLLLEATADIQKYRFSHNPANKDKWIAGGIWRYSRHPNYMGEMLVWIGIYLTVVTSLTTAATLFALVGPLFIILLLLFISGLPPLEKSADKHWGANSAYQAYKRRTSILVPWPPRQ